MGANATIYCLRELTDYVEFERLCNDLLVLEGYGDIEPLGGFKDKGRDAINFNKSSGITTIFAYSVRENWRVKLEEDAFKIKSHNHQCDELCFVTTEHFSIYERDQAIEYIRATFGWTLTLIGLEWLRLRLDVKYPRIKEIHPQIFPPEFLKIPVLFNQGKSCLFINYVKEDEVFAGWLTQRLTAEGYQVWISRDKLIGGEDVEKHIDDAIKQESCRFLAILSSNSISNTESFRQRIIGQTVATEQKIDFIIPLMLEDIRVQDRYLSKLTSIEFSSSWAKGLKNLLQKLEESKCPKPLYNGKQLINQGLEGNNVITHSPEEIYSNCLKVISIPSVIRRYRLTQPIMDSDVFELSKHWAFRKVNENILLSFCDPTYEVRSKFKIMYDGGGMWSNLDYINGIYVPNLVSELIRKSLYIKCIQLGLKFCSISGLYYFDSGLVLGDRLKFTRPDGQKTYVSALGNRKYKKLDEYTYYLSPDFSTSRSLFDDYTVILNIKIRFANTKGIITGKKVNYRRKHLTKDWWNREWFNRIMAVLQFLSEGAPEIKIGNSSDQTLIVCATPIKFLSSISIDEKSIEKSEFHSTLINYYDEDEDIEEIDQDIRVQGEL